MRTLLEELAEIALAAGREIMPIYHFAHEVREKADGSAVTDADECAEALICERLRALDGNCPILAEEAAARGEIPDIGTRFFVVDPLDGTREFVDRTGEFTVNIALVQDGRPLAGVVYAPALARLWYGAAGEGAFVEDVDPDTHTRKGETRAITARPCPQKDLVAVASRSHRSAETETLLERLGAADFRPAGSSLKFCLVAEGEADVYPRLGRTMEWDTAAGQAVLEAAGGRVHVLEDGDEKGPLTYGKAERGFDNPCFIAWGA
jgi:3'(2'), 5'-bisphosphate nucleotidase